MSRSRRVRLLACVLVAGVIALPSTIAQASNFGDTGGCSYLTGGSGAGGDNCVSFDSSSIHTVQFYGLGNQFPGIDTELTWAVNNQLDSRTQMSSFVTTCSGVCDVRAMDNDYNFVNFFGWVDCPADASTSTRFVEDTGSNERTCRPQDLRFNGRFSGANGSCGLSDCYDLQVERRALACHELGHTTGLLHETGGDSLSVSCMRENTVAHHQRVYSAEDIGHINSEY